MKIRHKEQNLSVFERFQVFQVIRYFYLKMYCDIYTLKECGRKPIQSCTISKCT